MKPFLLSLTIIYLSLRYILLAKITKTKKLLLLIVLSLPPFIENFFSPRAQNFIGKTYPIYLEISYFIAITFTNLFLLTFLIDSLILIIGLIGLLLKKYNILNKQTFKKISIFCIIVTLILMPNLYFQGYKTPNIKTVIFESEKIKETKEIAILTDFHINRKISVKRMKKIIEKTNNLKTDIVVLIGDIIDDTEENIKEQLEALKQLKPNEKVYFVSGNHEFYYGYSKSTKLLEDIGFNNIERTGINLSDEIFIAGIPDAVCYKKKYKERDCNSIKEDIVKAFEKSNDQQYKILLSHTPENFEKENFDLLLSGHTHGGQTPYYLLNMLIQGKFITGKYKLNNNKMIYVSRGISQWGPQIRLLTPTEITRIILKNKEIKI